MKRIGIYIGLSGDETPNVEKLLNTWSKCAEEYKLETFGGADPPSGCTLSHISTPDLGFVGPYSKLIAGAVTCVSYIRQRSPDAIVQLIKPNTHATPITLSGAIFNVPSATRLSGDIFNSHHGLKGPPRIFAYILNSVINGTIPPRLSTKVIAFGPYGWTQLLQRNVSPDDLVILPPAGIEDRFHPVDNKLQCRDELDIDYEGKLALYVGRLTDLKGMRFLQDVMRKVLSETETKFLLVGDGSFREKFIREFGDAVITPGTVPYPDIDQYYKAADLYIHPSRFEGIPLVVLEALSTGLPVLSRRAGDIPSVTPNIVDSPEEMAQRIQNNEYTSEWLNKKLFTVEYQRETLQQLLGSVVTDDSSGRA